jgi:hypothetical protein
MTPNKQNQLRSKVNRNSKTHWTSGPSPINAEVRVLTDAEIAFLKNCRLLVGEGGPSNFHRYK